MSAEYPLQLELSPPPSVAEALQAFAPVPGVILFESRRVRPGVGRYTFLTADPCRQHEVARAVYGSDPFAEPRRWLRELAPDELLSTDSLSSPTPNAPHRPTEAAQGITASLSADAGRLPLPFQGGLAGYLGYELGTCWEQIPRAKQDEFQLPDAWIGLYDWTLAWDAETNRCWLISQGWPETDPGSRLQRARARVEWVLARLQQDGHRDRLPISLCGVKSKSNSSPLPSLHVDELIGQPVPGDHPLRSDFQPDEYRAAVSRAIEYIRAGDIFQVNLSQRLLAPWERDPVELYLRLRDRNPAPFAGYLACDDWAVVSASPERFLQMSAGGEVETRPIKGTRRRGLFPEADLFTGDELRESAKDQAENVMIVDLLRNDLSRVCRPGTIRVPQLCAVETYETVQHLVSEVRGQLRPGQTVWDLLAACFPGGSITGAPKIRAMQIIAELEPTVRGPYCGSLFYLSATGDCDSSILIRTFVVRRGWAQCSVGGGIVVGSDPELEYQETWHKAEGMLRALRD